MNIIHSGSSRHKEQNIMAFLVQVAEHDMFFYFLCHRGVNRLEASLNQLS